MQRRLTAYRQVMDVFVGPCSPGACNPPDDLLTASLQGDPLVPEARVSPSPTASSAYMISLSPSSGLTVCSTKDRSGVSCFWTSTAIAASACFTPASMNTPNVCNRLALLLPCLNGSTAGEVTSWCRSHSSFSVSLCSPNIVFAVKHLRFIMAF